jgi:dihydropteroate synthase
MGILNVTPDSFSDGGLFLDAGAAVARAQQMEEEGAACIDIGGESTRPGSARTEAEEELRRVLPVIEALAGRLRAPLSVDTVRPQVAERALAAGASIINYVAFTGATAAMAELAQRAGAALVLTHVRGEPATMHQLPPLADPAGEVRDGLEKLKAEAVAAGLPAERVWLDPGLGFGKNGDENFAVLARLGELQQLGCPLVVGPSRKSFLGRLLDLPVGQRRFGAAATVTAAVLAGAHVVRVHDVAEMAQVARVADAIRAHARMNAGA